MPLLKSVYNFFSSSKNSARVTGARAHTKESSPIPTQTNNNDYARSTKDVHLPFDFDQS